MTDAPERIWIDGSPSPDNEWFVEPTIGYCEVEYIRADLVPQPPQEPTPEAVERAARAHWSSFEAGYSWDSMAESTRNTCLRAARAAILAAAAPA